MNAASARGAGIAAPVIAAPGDWLRLIGGLAVVYFACAWSAEALHSYRGEWGLAVGALAVSALLLVEMALFARAPSDAARALGLGRPARTGIAAALALSAVLAAILPVFVMATGAATQVHPNALWLAAGLFAQAGVFEETLFRGYLFGHLREGRNFWSAAALSALPFTLVHLPMFATQDALVAFFAIALALAMSFPLARLYELAGRTIWAPAIVHAAAQGAIKLVVFEDRDALTNLAMIWMCAAAILPWAVFLLPSPNPLPRAGEGYDQTQ